VLQREEDALRAYSSFLGSKIWGTYPSIAEKVEFYTGLGLDLKETEREGFLKMLELKMKPGQGDEGGVFNGLATPAHGSVAHLQFITEASCA